VLNGGKESAQRSDFNTHKKRKFEGCKTEENRLGARKQKKTQMKGK
jgi:hypothetical protein